MDINKNFFKNLIATIVISLMGIFSVNTSVYAVVIQNSHVTDQVSPLTGRNWHYEYTVFNDSFDDGTDDRPLQQGLVVDWELPYFEDMNIRNINSPYGWESKIETIGVRNDATGWDGIAAWNDPNDPWFQRLNGSQNPIFQATQVLHWYCNDPQVFRGEGLWADCLGEESRGGEIIFPNDSLSGFSFDASFGPVEAPYQTSWFFLPVNTGDPSFPSGVSIAGSPSTLYPTASVPTPSTIALFGLGLLGMISCGKKKRVSNVDLII